jgi:hypothetical protein
MLDYGRPSAVFDLPDGTRAFQWTVTSSGTIPMTDTSTSNVYGYGGWASVTTTNTTYSPYSQTCLYTLIGKQNGKDWIVTSFRKPTFFCE